MVLFAILLYFDSLTNVIFLFSTFTALRDPGVLNRECCICEVA